MGLSVLASGTGTILQAILDAEIPVVVVIVDRACGAVERARRAGVPVELVERGPITPEFDRVRYSERVAKVLQCHNPGLVAMAGFNTILEKPIFDVFGGRILNTHPALLPAFPGTRAVEQALVAGVTVTGCTIHVATIEVDIGPILAQEEVPILDDDTVESLHERIKEVERRLYPKTIKRLMSDDPPSL